MDNAPPVKPWGKVKKHHLPSKVCEIIKTQPRKPSGIFSSSSENNTNRKQNMISFPEYLIFTSATFVRTTFGSSKL
jgi:hypothetical protein